MSPKSERPYAFLLRIQRHCSGLANGQRSPAAAYDPHRRPSGATRVRRDRTLFGVPWDCKSWSRQFDALLTADQNIEFQQNLKTLPMAVVVLVANSNRLESLEPLVPDVLR